MPFNLVVFFGNTYCRVNLEQMLYLPCQLLYAELVLLKRRHAFYWSILYGFNCYCFSPIFLWVFVESCMKILKRSNFRFHSISILQTLLAKQTWYFLSQPSLYLVEENMLAIIWPFRYAVVRIKGVVTILLLLLFLLAVRVL